MSDMRIRVAQTDQQIADCYAVMQELRPHFTLESFVERVNFQRQAGYSLVYLETGGAPVAVAGFQVRETLADGRFLHVDDLVTLKVERSRGYGAKLLRWLTERARELSCDGVQLDSAVRRQDAHRFYEREGMNVIAYHFGFPLRSPTEQE